jgi:multidrug efflux pump subunit AcrA (membrane-fusion protein)
MNGRLYVLLAGAVATLPPAAGCQQSAGNSLPEAPAAEQPARAVAVVKPERKTIRRAVGQPGFVQPFERTSIVAKVPGYVQKWNVDIGDRVKKGDVLAELWVPEMVAQLELKEQQVHQAEKALAMARAQVASARALVEEAEAAVAKAEATNDYWKGQSGRFAGLVKKSVLDQQTGEETLNQYRSATAALKEARAKVESARATQREKEAARDKAEVDIRVAEADRRQQAELVGYARLTAPYEEGVVTQRTVNTWQFVQPATGGQGDVLYVVERTEVVRVFVSVPETDADWVQVGTPATVRVQALQGREFKGQVTRTAWSLNPTTRTLLTEIDLPNADGRLRPGMYAYATLDAQWRDVLTLPASAVATEGDVNVGYQTFCYIVEGGRAKRTPVEIGARNGQLVEVLKKQAPGGGPGEAPRWEPFTGEEEVVGGDLSGLKDGQAVGAAAKP